MKLEEIDLTKATGHECPEINGHEGDWYLAEIQFSTDKKPFYTVGHFSRQWFGLHFDCDWGMSGLQFDAPGYNCSAWKRLWRINPE